MLFFTVAYHSCVNPEMEGIVKLDQKTCLTFASGLFDEGQFTTALYNSPLGLKSPQHTCLCRLLDMCWKT